MLVGAAVCVAAIAVTVVVAAGRGGSPRSRPDSSATTRPGAGAALAGTQGSRPLPNHSGTSGSPARKSTGLATCAAPGPSAASGGLTMIATTRGAIPRYDRPGGPPEGTIPASWYGAVSALPVIAQQPGWLEVRLATRPNGSTAWVHQADVAVAGTPYWISVDLTTRHLALFRLGQLVMSAPAGVGTGQDPTPTGQYFVAFLEASPSPGYGPFIMVTSAHSDAIADWEGSGDAVIGIHGPLGADSLIGTSGAYLSHGCVRIPIADLTQLRDVPAGSPISICT
jgi:hypothetical protein